MPNGMAYNSYVILDDKVAVMDTVDANFKHEWLDNLEQALGGRKPDYLIVQHMEPDHAANVANFICAVISHHNLRPVYHWRKYKSKIMISQTQCRTILYFQFLPFQIQSEEILDHYKCLRIGYYCSTGIYFQKVRYICANGTLAGGYGDL